MTTPRVIILTGDRGVGKTTWILALCRYWKEVNRPFFGTAEPKIFENGELVGIAARDLASGQKRTLAVRDDEPGLRIGRWRFLEEVIAFANECYQPDILEGIAVIDEIGALELQGLGLSVPWGALKNGRYPRALLVVRPELVEEVQSRMAGDRLIISFSAEILRMGPNEMDLFIEKIFHGFPIRTDI